MTSVQIQQIANGFIVTARSNTPGVLASSPAGNSTYCADLAAVNALLATIFAVQS